MASTYAILITVVEDKMNTDNMEKSGSPMLSPLQTNEGMDGSGSQFQGQNDDAEDDDLVLKRRYAPL